jgi:NTE family protein
VNLLDHFGRTRNKAEPPRPTKIGLALGSGGARGWAHIGVINAIAQCHIPINCVAGTSMGALVGAALAAGKTDELHHVALVMDWKRLIYYFFELNFPRSGLIDGSRIVEFLKEHIVSVDIRKLSLPLAVIAADVMTGREVVISEGNVVEAVRASIAIPGMFTPVIMGNDILVDGGLVNPLPISVLRSMGADFVIAVDVTGDPEDQFGESKSHSRTEVSTPPESDISHSLLQRIEEKLRGFDLLNLRASLFQRSKSPNIFDILGNTFRIVERQVTRTRLQLEPPDILIRPAVCDIGTMEFNKASECIAAGYSSAMEALSAYPNLSSPG